MDLPLFQVIKSRLVEKGVMRISEVKIENYRSIRSLSFGLQNFTTIIGPNNAGKTNIMLALRLFFNPSSRGISEEDFHLKHIEDPIAITITFTNLTVPEREQLGKYELSGNLTVRKSISLEEGSVIAKLQALTREPVNQLLKASVFDQNKPQITSAIESGTLPDYFLGVTGRLSKASYTSGLERYLSENSSTITWDTPSWSESFFGWKSVAEGQLMDILYIPAVRDASDESKATSGNYFGKLVDLMISQLASERFSEAKGILDRLRVLFAGGEDGTDRIQEIGELETKLSDSLAEHMPGVKARLQIKAPEFADLIRDSATLMINDGVDTSVEFKGHGLQRSVVLSIMRLYADLIRSSSVEHSGSNNMVLFALEEPELYLHPHMQRHLFELLKRISEVNQVIVCTHSPYFVSVPDYREIALVSKGTVEAGTSVKQVTGELFNGEEKLQFRMLADFDSHKNELFFAKRIVLVEGPTEEIALTLTGKKMDKDFDTAGVTIVSCESKSNIPFYQDVLNAFSIPYVVIHDLDVREGRDENDNAVDRRRNSAIASKANGNLILMFEPYFEQDCSLIGKGPFDVYSELYSRDSVAFPQKLKQIVDSITEVQ
jgi:putative ATP-dependent endonuclease of the OLD family